MSDIIDKANQSSAALLALQIEAQRQPLNEPVHVIDGKHYCIDCDEPINSERIKKMPNASRCVACQTIEEKKDKHRA